MNKLKDTFLLLFWGIVAGAFFVGCILGFMYVFNSVGSLLSFSSIRSPYLRSALACIALALLVGVIMSVMSLISWIWTKTHKNYWDVANQIFSQEVRFKLHANSLACAILNGNDWKIMQLMGNKRDLWPTVSNQVLVRGITPLHVATGVGSKTACELLLYYKADSLRPDRNGRTPMDYAIQYGHKDIIKLLEKHIAK